MASEVEKSVCRHCRGEQKVAFAGRLQPCPKCSPDWPQFAETLRVRHREVRAALAVGDQMVRIANGRSAELGPLGAGKMPDGAIGDLVTDGCCAEARHRACVCVRSTFCPTHGVRCVGSHD